MRIKSIKIIMWLILGLVFLNWAVPFAQKTLKRRYIVPEEYDQRTFQEHFDDISRRFQEGGQ